MFLAELQPGIILNGFVSLSLSIISVSFIHYLIKIRNKLDHLMQAYVWFWIVTAFVWFFVSSRYILIGLSYSGKDLILLLELLIQISIFMTGPALFYFLGYALYRSKTLASLLALVSFVFAVISTAYMMLPGGLTLLEITYFSAETGLGEIPMSIFSSQVMVIIVLLLVLLLKNYILRVKTADEGVRFQLLYIVSILGYVILGALDQSKIFSDWAIILIRSLYAGIFLFMYIILKKEMDDNEKYFVSINEIKK